MSEGKTYTCDGWRYVLLPDDSAMLAGIEGSSVELSIPKRLDGHPVTHIADGALRGLPSVVRLAIPATVRAIGAMAFADCAGLEEVRLEGHPGALGAGLFDGCASLKRLVLNRPADWGYDAGDREYIIDLPGRIRAEDGVLFSGDGHTLLLYPAARNIPKYRVPEGVTAIAPYACWGAPFSSILLPPGVKSVGEYAFRDSNLRSAALPDGMAEIAHGAFYHCARLERAELPDSVERIGDLAFWDCERLRAVRFPGCLKVIGRFAFFGADLREADLPEGTTAIGEHAFHGCERLTRLELPQSLEYMGSGAFAYCESLTEATVPSRAAELMLGVFDHCSKLERLAVQGMDTAVSCPEGLLPRLKLRPDFTLVACPGSRAQRDAAALGLPCLADDRVRNDH